jgi:peptidoglycan hydrolase-like protein with peptidoglycan-binding domain
MGEMKKSAVGGLLRKGSRGDEVRELQRKLGQLGFDLSADGIFGDDTEKAVIQLQTMFGYTVDALVGDGTKKLIDAQIGYGWNAKSADAAQRALESQGKGGAAKQVSGNASQSMPQQQGKPQPTAAKPPGIPPKGAQKAHHQK